MTDSPGRPRDTAIDDVVLAATLRLLARHGYAGLRINDVAEASRVAKTTIYRRWPTLVHLVVAAMEQALGERSAPTTGDVLSDLDRLLEAGFGAFTGSGSALLAVALDIHRHSDAELRTTYRRRIIDPIRSRAVSLIAEGIEREMFASEAAPETLVDAIIGGLVYRLAILAEPVTVEQAKIFAHEIVNARTRKSTD